VGFRETKKKRSARADRSAGNLHRRAVRKKEANGRDRRRRLERRLP
jgi:hypothetical protein